jgi:FlaG/FlaF family flagellin (archaellin)
VIAIAIAISGGSVLAVDQYYDDFESTAEGSLPSGWGAASGVAVVTGLQQSVTYTPSGMKGADTKLMYVDQDADATNGTPVVSSTSSNVWIDMWIAPNLYDGVATNRDFATGSTAAFFFDSNGCVVVNQTVGSTNWTVISTDASGDPLSVEDNDVATNMQRVTVYMNYAGDNWDLFLGDSLVEEDIPFNSATATELSKITLSDDVYADYVTVSATNYPSAATWASGETLDSDEDGDGIDDAYELHYFQAVASHYPDTDTDGDGRSDGEEFVDGTDPTDKNDKSWVIPYFEKFAGITLSRPILRIATAPSQSWPAPPR